MQIYIAPLKQSSQRRLKEWAWHNP